MLLGVFGFGACCSSEGLRTVGVVRAVIAVLLSVTVVLFDADSSLYCSRNGNGGLWRRGEVPAGAGLALCQVGVGM